MEQVDLSSKIYQVLNYKRLYEQVNQAASIEQFDFSTIAGTSRALLASGIPAAINDIEKGAENAFELSLDLQQQPSLLKALQNLGFDIFPLASMPKGEKYCIVHDNLPQLEKFLSGQEKPKVRRFSALKNKIISPVIRQHGRLHIRFYNHETDPTKLIAVSHIDPPDPGHFNLLKHLHGKIEVDYKKGTELFQKVLEFLQGNQRNSEVA